MPTYATPAAGRGGRPGRCGDLENLLVGSERRVEATLSAPDPPEMMAANGDQSGLAVRQPPGNTRRQGALGLGQPTEQLLGYGQDPAGRRFQHPLAFVELGQGP